MSRVLFFVLVQVCPRAALLQDCHANCVNDSVNVMRVVYLVANELRTWSLRRAVVRALSTKATILRGGLQVVPRSFLVPLIGAFVVLASNVYATIAIRVASVSRNCIVIRFGMLCAMVVSRPVCCVATVFPCLQVTRVRRVTFVIGVTFSVTTSGPIVQGLIYRLTNGSRGLSLRPRSRFRTFAIYVVTSFFRAVKRSSKYFFPFPSAIPPRSIIVPTYVRTMVFTSRLYYLIGSKGLPLHYEISRRTVRMVVGCRIRLLVIHVQSTCFSPVSNRYHYYQVRTAFCGHCPYQGNYGTFSQFRVLVPTVLLLYNTTWNGVRVSTLYETVFYRPLSKTFGLRGVHLPYFSILNGSRKGVLANEPNTLSAMAVAIRTVSLVVRTVCSRSIWVRHFYVMFLPLYLATPTIGQRVSVYFFVVELLTTSKGSLVRGEEGVNRPLVLTSLISSLYPNLCYQRSIGRTRVVCYLRLFQKGRCSLRLFSTNLYLRLVILVGGVREKLVSIIFMNVRIWTSYTTSISLGDQVASVLLQLRSYFFCFL